MKRNRLISNENRKKCSELGLTINEFINTGKSYGRALSIIGASMQSPGEIFHITDHNPRGDRNLKEIIERTILKLKLKYLEVGYVGSSLGYWYIRYNVFEEVD